MNETTQGCANCWLSVSPSYIPPLGGGGVGYIGIRTGQVGTGCHHSGLALCYFWQHRCKCKCSRLPQHYTLFNCNRTTVVVTAKVGFTSLCTSFWHSILFNCFSMTFYNVDIDRIGSCKIPPVFTENPLSRHQLIPRGSDIQYVYPANTIQGVSAISACVRVAWWSWWSLFTPSRLQWYSS